MYPRNVGPCAHLGDALSVADKKRHGLPVHRTYGPCQHPSKPNKGQSLVCPCTGCGVRCNGYTPPPPDSPL